MAKLRRGRLAAGVLSAVMLGAAVPFAGTIADNGSKVIAAEGTVLYTNDFEDGEAGKFVARMNEDDKVVVAVESEDAAHGGSKYLSCTGREQSWHGISLPAAGLMEPGEEYMVNAAVKAKWYCEVVLSMQYDDSTGSTHYVNIQKVQSGGEWKELENVKFSFPKGTTNCSIYFEGNGDASVPLYLDDFTLSTVPEAEMEDIPSLKDLYSPYFRFGTAATDSELASKSAQKLIKKHFNSLTPGNELKPEAVLDQAACKAKGDNVNPQVKIDAARGILDFCRDNNIPVRGHTLVWHSQTPGWFFKEGFDKDGDFVSKEVMIQRMENYIKNLMELIAKEYPTVTFYAWDVVNEAWLDNGTPRQPGVYDEDRDSSGWVKVFGDNSFIKYAFTFARKYAPKGCKLYYNDFNEYIDGKTNAILKMVEELKADNLIDGIGMQSHLDVRQGQDAFPSVGQYEKAMAAFCATGLDVQVTELDATVGQSNEAGFKAQAEYYKGILDCCKKYADNISAVVVWGTTDDKSWRTEKSPLLFNGDFTAKPCYYSITEGMTMPENIPTEPAPTSQPTEAPTVPTETTAVSTEAVTTPTETEPQPTTLDTQAPTEEPTTAPTEIVTTPPVENPTEEVKASKFGDVDMNGMVELADVTKLSKYLLNSTLFALDSDVAAKNSDVTRDGKVDSLDLSKLLEFNLGQITEDEL